MKWMELDPYYELCFERNLWFRFLTSEDYNSKCLNGKTATFSTYLLAKHNFFKEIQEQFQRESVKNSDYSRSRERNNRNQR